MQIIATQARQGLIIIHDGDVLYFLHLHLLPPAQRLDVSSLPNTPETSRNRRKIHTRSRQATGPVMCPQCAQVAQGLVSSGPPPHHQSLPPLHRPRLPRLQRQPLLPSKAHSRAIMLSLVNARSPTSGCRGSAQAYSVPKFEAASLPAAPPDFLAFFFAFFFCRLATRF